MVSDIPIVEHFEKQKQTNVITKNGVNFLT